MQTQQSRSYRFGYLTADEEDAFVVAQANEPLDEEGRFVNA